MTASHKSRAAESPFTSREHFEQALERALAVAKSGQPQALFVVYVERFGEALARCGPDAEAALDALVQLALSQQVGYEARACRLASDRFALIKDRCPPRDALILARRILVALEGGVFRWKKLSFRLGARVSAVELGAPDITGVEDALRQAQEACGTSELLGNEGVLVLDGHPDERKALNREVEWRNHLREVL